MSQGEAEGEPQKKGKFGNVTKLLHSVKFCNCDMSFSLFFMWNQIIPIFHCVEEDTTEKSPEFLSLKWNNVSHGQLG